MHELDNDIKCNQMSWPNIPGWIHSLFFSIMTSQRKWKEPFFLVLLLVLVKITRYLKKLTDIFEKKLFAASISACPLLFSFHEANCQVHSEFRTDGCYVKL